MISLSQLNYFSPNQLHSLGTNSLTNIKDLLLYVPRRYIDYSHIFNFKDYKVGDLVTFWGKIISNKIQYGKSRRLVLVCSRHHLSLDIIFFQGISYYTQICKIGTEIAFSGKLVKFAGHFCMLHPEFEVLTGDDLVHTGKIVPIYKTTDGMRKNGLTSRTLREAVHMVLKNYQEFIQDYLSSSTLKSIRLLGIQDALHKIHFPMTYYEVKLAKERLAFDEIFVFSSIMQHKKHERRKLRKTYPLIRREKKWPSQLRDSLDFTLTNDQHEAITKLCEAAYSPHPFGILLQGDVGSGKTLVALLLALEYVEEKIQVALMAPTEVLAKQHYKTATQLLSIFPFIPIELLLGTDTPLNKKSKLDRIAKGDSLLIIGTHSLLQDKLTFFNLGLVVIDEQHRFGVKQREILRAKGNMPDILAMTATPIPRSLTLALYGDLDTLFIKEKPGNRQEIETFLFQEEDLSRIYASIKKYISQGRQAYIIYPIIDESNTRTWASLTQDYEYLKTEIFPGENIDILHGQLSTDDKAMTMERFRENRISILVCTTVIEVGVDVPNANVIVIRESDKFGLSQLHQLRGRVGRDKYKSFCALVASKNITAEGQQRLEAMCNSNDGFYLAEKDFEIRGTGELLGLKQSGSSEFRIADLRYQSHLIPLANQVFQSNPNLLYSVFDKKTMKNLLSKGIILFTN